MRLLGGHIMKAAEQAKVPAGDALAVDRDVFAEVVETAIHKHPKIWFKKKSLHYLKTRFQLLWRPAPYGSRIGGRYRARLRTRAVGFL